MVNIKEEDEMRSIEVNVAGLSSYADAEKAARKIAAQAGADLSLLAWYDKAKGTGAPQEVCSSEKSRCPRDYAEHHKADIRVSINNDAYEFFFVRIPADADALDAEEVGAVHEHAKGKEFDNIQGG